MLLCGPLHQPGFLWAEHFRVLIPFIAINKTYFITRTRACQAPDSDGNAPLLLAAGTQHFPRICP